jgi:hypothetical protein
LDSALVRCAVLVVDIVASIFVPNRALKLKKPSAGFFAPANGSRNLFSEALQAGPGTATAIIMGRSSGSRPTERAELDVEPGRANAGRLVLSEVIGYSLQ